MPLQRPFDPADRERNPPPASPFFSMLASARFQTALRWAILGLYVALTLWRAPGIIWPGRFWAEEGSVYFREAYLHAPLQVLLTPNLGYYSLLNKVASIAAVHAVPMEYAPLVTLLFALAMQALPAALLLFSRIAALPTLAHRTAALALVLLVQPNQEIWLNTINSQYFLCISTGLILISAPTNRATHFLRLGILLLAGLTGIVSALLWPLFLWDYGRTRRARRLHEVAALGLAAGLQAVVVLAGTGRAVQPVWSLLSLALAGKQWVLPLFGYAAFDGFIEFLRKWPRATDFPWSLALCLPYGLVALAVWRQRNGTAGRLLAAAGGVAVVSLAFSLPAQQLESFGYSCITATADGRYYYAPNALLALALLALAAAPGSPGGRAAVAIRSSAGLLLICLLATGAANFRHYGGWSHGPDWPAEVRAWRAGQIDTLAVWPAPWRLDLRRNPPDPETRRP